MCQLCLEGRELICSQEFLKQAVENLKKADRTVVGGIFEVFGFFRDENNFSPFQLRVLRIFEIGNRVYSEGNKGGG